MPSNELSRWADSAMYAASPTPQEGPVVHLLSMSADPLGEIAAACMMYEGKVIRRFSEITDDQRRHYFEQVRKTKLQAPFEFVHFHFLIDGVTRSLTHQMVRQRTACLSGDVTVYTVRRERRYSMAELWQKWQNGGHDKKAVKCMKIRTSDDDGQIVYRRIASVAQSGIKPVYQVTTHDSRIIKTTIDHRFLRPDGSYSELGELAVGDQVVSNGKKWTPEMRAHFSEWCRENRPANPDAYKGLDPGHRIAQKKYGHRLSEGCAWCGEEAKQLAHIDGDPMNNSPENVQPMCIDCHICMDRDVFPEKTYASQITSIEYVGEEMTYDLGMEGEFPRFVANGLLVHNCFAQESLRFAVKEDFPVALPPSIAEGSDAHATWTSATHEIERCYIDLIESGIPAEDARGLLPHNILTRLHYGTNLRALLDHAGNRLCTQAQFEHRLLWSRMIEAIRLYPYSGNHGERLGNAWQFAMLSSIFRPVCYLTGRCEFKADFDRKCSIRSRVDAHALKGEPGETWTDIQPAEWLTNPGAAR